MRKDASTSRERQATVHNKNIMDSKTRYEKINIICPYFSFNFVFSYLGIGTNLIRNPLDESLLQVCDRPSCQDYPISDSPDQN